MPRDRRLERARSVGPQQRLTASLFSPRLLDSASTRPGREWIRSLAGAGAAETWKHGGLSQREPPRLLRRPRLLLFRSATRLSARELESICPPAETGRLWHHTRGPQRLFRGGFRDTLSFSGQRRRLRSSSAREEKMGPFLPPGHGAALEGLCLRRESCPHIPLLGYSGTQSRGVKGVC